MSERDRWTEQEWLVLATGPVAAAGLIIGADDASLVGTFKEGRAFAKTMKASRKQVGRPAVVAELIEYAAKHQKEVAAAGPSSDSLEGTVAASRSKLAEVAGLASRFSPEERASYAEWVLEIARAGAEAYEEAGAQDRVSDAERAALAEIDDILRGAK